VVSAYHPSYSGSINRRIEVQAGPSKKQNPVSEITKAKRAGSVAQVVEFLPSKLKSLSSNPELQKNKYIKVIIKVKC
jgi:hypothetical protein